jgi:hypothetical protein
MILLFNKVENEFFHMHTGLNNFRNISSCFSNDWFYIFFDNEFNSILRKPSRELYRKLL